jgi:hypothetical protein
VLAEGPLLDTRSVEYLAEHRRERHLLIGGAQFFVVFRPAAYFRGLLLTVPVIFLRFAVSGLFGIVVIRAGGAIDRHRISSYFQSSPYIWPRRTRRFSAT